MKTIEYQVPIIDLCSMEKEIGFGGRPFDLCYLVSMDKVVVSTSRCDGLSPVSPEIAVVRWYIFESGEKEPNICARMLLRGTCLVDLIPVPQTHKREIDLALGRREGTPSYIWAVNVL